MYMYVCIYIYTSININFLFRIHFGARKGCFCTMAERCFVCNSIAKPLRMFHCHSQACQKSERVTRYVLCDYCADRHTCHFCSSLAEALDIQTESDSSSEVPPTSNQLSLLEVTRSPREFFTALFENQELQSCRGELEREGHP
jgi:hypothetical protein